MSESGADSSKVLTASKVEARAVHALHHQQRDRGGLAGCASC